jgi:transposase
MRRSESKTQPPSCAGCAERDRRIAELEARNAALEKRLTEQGKRIEQLEALLDQRQRGSKRQAAPFAKGSPKTEPKKPGRKPGSDYGTKACRAAPPRIDEEHHAPLPDACPHCGDGVLHLERTAEQYQTEIPTRPIHRKFNIEIGCCNGCRKRVQGRHPLQTSDALGAASSQLGPDAQALIVHLNKEAGLSQGKISRLLQTAFGIDLSRGGACQSMLRSARRCRGEAERIVDHVRQSDAATSDETGWRIGGRSAWLHTAATVDAVAYRIDPRRGYEAMRKLLGDDYAGTLVHDGWAPYRLFLHATHQTCLAHLLRRCHEMLEVAIGGAVVFPRQIKALLKEALDIRDQRDAGQITAIAAAEAADDLQARILKRIEPIKTHPANERLASHLRRHRDHLLTFLKEEGIDATNWRAEQALRPAVVNRKVWGGSRTQAGAEAQSILLTISQTARLRGIDPLRWLSQHLRSPDPPPNRRLLANG